jgi:hypothetical protein
MLYFSTSGIVKHEYKNFNIHHRGAGEKKSPDVETGAKTS